jgi:hypothetical protein
MFGHYRVQSGKKPHSDLNRKSLWKELLTAAGGMDRLTICKENSGI